ncbi:unnamed protein product [Adineta ricciae]|uniref:Uncharacterized protein n=1 Tax=Adineta ricciae TaxID=249248 RepID=A0A814FTM8_ADIRI|nr:unnamed protein product [Adineta ricciae]
MPSKRIMQISLPSAKLECISQRHRNVSDDDDIIRSRLLYEGDHGNDDRRILALMKLFNSSSSDIEKLHSLLYSVEHSYRLINSSLRMNQHEQICYASKTRHMSDIVQKLRQEVKRSEERLMKAKLKRANLRQCNQRIDKIMQLDTRKQLRAQQLHTLERKRYFEHLRQTFEAKYYVFVNEFREMFTFYSSFQQRLRQIAIYMRPIFEFDDVLKQDMHEDGVNDNTIEHQSMLLSSRNDRQRTYSDSSMNSIDGDDNPNKGKNQDRSETLLFKNIPAEPLYSNDVELYGAQLVNPVSILSSSLSIE